MAEEPASSHTRQGLEGAQKLDASVGQDLAAAVRRVTSYWRGVLEKKDNAEESQQDIAEEIKEAD